MQKHNIYTETDAKQFLKTQHKTSIDLRVYDIDYLKFFKTLSRKKDIPDIKKLTIANETLTKSLAFMEKMTFLTKLEINFHFESLEGIENLQSLKTLIICQDVTTINLSGIEFLPNLKVLKIYNATIDQICLINYLTNLKILSLECCNFDSKLDLINLSKLKRLIIYEGPDMLKLTLSPKARLVDFKIDLTKFKKIVNLNTSRLVRFNARYCNLKDLSLIAGAKRLKQLFVCGNPFSDLSHFKEFTLLEYACIIGRTYSDHPRGPGPLPIEVYKTAGIMNQYMALWLHSTDFNIEFHDHCDIYDIR
jgi:hypothetical protein